jgi:hypothetical protein
LLSCAFFDARATSRLKALARLRSPQWSAALDYTPGTSPFQTKGIRFLGTESFFGKASPEGMTAVYSQITDPALLRFIQQKFLAASWYDALPVASLIRAEARALKLPVEDYLRQRTEWQAKSDFNGVYRALLKLTTPKSLVERMPKMLSRYHNFGAMQIVEEDTRRLKLAFSGAPAPLGFWLSTVIGTYTRCVVEYCGAPLPDTRVGAMRSDGELHGVDLVRFDIELSWGR